MADRTDPNDPKYTSNPDWYEFRDGLWYKTQGKNGGLNLDSEEFWNDPNSDWTRDWSNLGHALGYQPKEVVPDAPGGDIDATAQDEERKRTGVLLAQLQQQAASGGGAWENSLADSTERARSSAMALGQSQQGVGYGSALRNIGNAQASASQRSVGQGKILRAQSQAGAQDQLGTLLTAQGKGDANLAAANAAARQGITLLNNSLNSEAQKKITQDSTSLGGMSLGAMYEGGEVPEDAPPEPEQEEEGSDFGALLQRALAGLSLGEMSDGGEVPGEPMVGGDDPKNDTVSAMLSPGEIVIPRSHAGSPEQAADFVRALQSRGQVQHFDAGGQVDDGTGLRDKPGNSNDALGGITSIFLPHVGAAIRGSGANQSAPSIENGGLLNTKNYDATRTQQMANADLIQRRASGQGLSAAPQQMQNTTDANIAAAMAQGAKGGGMGAGNVLQHTTAANQGAAGGAAETSGNEQAAAQQSLGSVLSNQRSADIAMAVARQQAAFRQTQINAGLGLEQQAALRSILSGAGQAASTYSTAGGKKTDDSYDLNDTNTLDFDYGNGNEWNEYPGNRSADLHDPNDKWEGGEITDSRADDFVAALRRAKR